MRKGPKGGIASSLQFAKMNEEQTWTCRQPSGEILSDKGFLEEGFIFLFFGISGMSSIFLLKEEAIVRFGR